MTANKRRVSLLVFVLTATALLITLGAANALYRSDERQPVVDDAGGSYIDEDIFASNSIAPDVAISAKCDRNFFNCRLMKEILKTHRFLQRNENGLPYTKDTRNLTPESENIRLVIDTQANGYLNLYKITHKRKFLKEAENRLDYILSVQNNFTFDGQVGYTFLSAYELDRNPAYLKLGLKIADQCIGLPEKDKILNWGLMCAMDLAKAYRITNNITYLNESWHFVRNNAPQQLRDGSFPHNILNNPNYSSNAPYTSWMIYELNQIRSDDPQNPDIEAALIKANTFLKNRVNQNGSLNYEDANGTYYWDSTYDETRGFNNELAYFGYDLRTMGENERSKNVLRFLFNQQDTGKNSGGYSDKWGYSEPGNLWANGNPSVVRTSIIFWMLTSIPLIDNSCQNGLAISCTITPSDCNSAFSELNSCSIGVSGTNVCINGRFTKCLNENLINYTFSVCDAEILSCDPSNPYCGVACEINGYNKCIDGNCSSCFYKTTGGCGDMCFDHPIC